LMEYFWPSSWPISSMECISSCSLSETLSSFILWTPADAPPAKRAARAAAFILEVLAMRAKGIISGKQVADGEKMMTEARW
jgi:hypothetical protein